MAQTDEKRKNLVNTVLIVMVGQVGCLTLGLILAAVFGGQWLDARFGTKPLFTLALLLAGIPLSVLLMLSIARRTIERLKLTGTSAEKDPSSE